MPGQQRGRLSSGRGNITVIGCSWVITTSPLASRGVNDVARIHLAQADPAADRGGDPAVDQLQPGAVDLSLVDLDRPIELADQGLLGISCCLGIESCVQSCW